MNTKDHRTSRPAAGAMHLERLSALRKRILQEDLAPSVLIVEDSPADARFIETPLGRLFGSRARSTVVPSLTLLAEHIKRHSYDVVLLDDRLSGVRAAEDGIRVIRLHLPHVPIVVVSRLMTRLRAQEVKVAGAFAALSKDDLDSFVLGEVVIAATKQIRYSPL